jgi:hypothetical protein
MIAMTTSPLTIHVDADAAKAYAAASSDDRRKIELLLSLRLRELVSSASSSGGDGTDRTDARAAEVCDSTPPASTGEDPQGQDRLARLRQAWGIWRDRDDVPNPEELRREWDRF